jgi:hypothetical protein
MRLRKSSLLVAAAGALALTAAFVPVANGANELQVYFNFNSEADKAPPPYSSVTAGTFGGFPLQGPIPLISDPTTPFPGGQLLIDSAAGTTMNQFSLDGTGAGGALDVMGKANSQAATKYCFDIGSFSTVGLHDLSLSFAIKAVSTAPGGAFTTLDLAYGTNGTTWTNFDTIAINQDGSFHIINDNLPSNNTVNGHSTFFLQFCFSGATNASGHVFVDNIQVNSVIPEPSTYLGALLGLLGVLVLCWYQREGLMRGLSFRRA